MVETKAIEKLKEYMEEHGLSQVQLAKKLGWTPSDLNTTLKGKKPLGRKRLQHIAKALGLTFEIGAEVPGEPVPPPRGELPVVSLAQGGPKGFFDDQGYPAGEGFKRVKRPYDVRDPHAYGVEIRGDSMAPKYEEGDIVIASPRKQVVSGDYCVVKTRQGEVMVKRVRFRDGMVILESLNPAYEPILLKKKDVAFCHRIVWVKQR